jgi:SAM-dependent methyltransferase
MDYEDYKAGASGFWFRAKLGMVRVLLKRATRSMTSGGPMRILDLGAGTGDDVALLAGYGDVYVVDVNKKALSFVPRALCKEIRVADAQKLPYPEGFFDLVLAYDVLEHVDDDRLAMAEIRRVLRMNGALVVSVPAYQALFGSHDRALDHKRRYSKRGLRSLLSIMRVERLRSWNFFLFPGIALVRIMQRDKPPKVNRAKMPWLIDELFYCLLSVENLLLRIGIPLPFGLSIVGIARKT